MQLVYLIVAEDLNGKYPKINVGVQSELEQRRFWSEHNHLPAGNKDMRASLRAIVERYLKYRQIMAKQDQQSDRITDAQLVDQINAYTHIYWETVELLG